MKKPLSIVIPIKSGSKNNNIELIYAIRSLVLNLNTIGDIFVIGNKIYSLKGLKCIRCNDEKGSQFKERNIYSKIIKAIEHPEVTDNFIFVNDDHFLTKAFDPFNLPFYHKGTLTETIDKNPGDYRKSLNHTRKFLLSQGKSTLDFDTHFPIVYNKRKFLDIFTHKCINWDQPFGYVIKSLYCNMSGIEGEFGGDCKIHHKMTYNDIKDKISDRSFFSTSDGCMNEDMIKVLKEFYPEKSEYEK